MNLKLDGLTTTLISVIGVLALHLENLVFGQLATQFFTPMAFCCSLLHSQNPLFFFPPYWARLIQFTHSLTTLLMYILVSSFHLRLGLPSFSSIQIYRPTFCARFISMRESQIKKIKSQIKFLTTFRLSCKLTTVILMVWRVADRLHYDARMQHDGAVVV